MSDVTVAAGDPLPSYEVTPDTVQLFCYSAITWNPHRIHYDAPYARDVEGYSDVLVQGPLMGSWLMRLCADWVAPWGRVDTMTYRTTTSVMPGTPLVVGGVVVTGGATPEAEIWVELPDGTKATHGRVTAIAEQ
ncbi:acyl dehydratase [Streptomyces leeuwenhoekii]|uniref:acyl dehydratase n=1 Tax=Streptomyces leeuwenhoekii TaxID=1437453 RepID=UPI00368C259D